MEIIPNIHAIPGITATPYLIIDQEGLTLVDTGMPRSGPKIRDYIIGLGHSIWDLNRILITHADVDHYGGLAFFKEKASVQVYASEKEAESIAQGEMSRPLKLTPLLKPLFQLVQLFFHPQPVTVDQVFQKEEILPVFGGLQVIFTPGHTPGHVSFFSPEKGVLFCGDSLKVDNGQIQISSGINTWDEELAVQSAIRQARLDPEIVCPGHGDVVREATGQMQALLSREI